MDACVDKSSTTNATETGNLEQLCRQLRQNVQSLQVEKANIEREIQSLSETLAANDGVGLRGNLVDPEGFPRNDIDIVAVRTARNRIIRLNNDHKKIMEQLEEALYQMHDASRKAGPSAALSEAMEVDSSDVANRRAVNQLQLAPFLLIDEVRPGSVAEQAGLEVGDHISKFGSVSADNFSGLQDIASVMRNTPAQGSISLVVCNPSRQNNVFHIDLVKPASATGMGLHVTPLPKPGSAT